MPDVRLPNGSLVALIAVAVVATAGGVLHALVILDRPANVDNRAERGPAIQVGRPPAPTTTPYGLPVADVGSARWANTHAAYPATDIFVRCGARLVSPVWGTVLEVRRVDSYDPVVDDPAARGGRSVSILGYDGVRFYLAHLDTIVAGLEPGDEVALGEALGTMGDSGRASACHLHFSISPPCPDEEWSVRRGAIWPHPFLDAWRRGEQPSPVAEVDAWLAAHPDACAAASSNRSVSDS